LMHNLQDKRLISRLKAGDNEAFEQLFKKYNQKLFNFCYRMLRSKQEAEEVVQNTFLKIWENRNSLDESYSFSSFLFKITQNKVFNEFRSKLNQRYYREYIAEYAEILENDTEKSINFAELEKTIKNLLEMVPERRRQIFLLSREDGLTYKEIARKLDISENTVDTQIRKTLDFFRQNLRMDYYHLPTSLL
jgi:RNA polymerase sigma-70 factor (family 1)